MRLGMPYRTGRGTAGVPFHVINRGARRAVLFESDGDYLSFLNCVDEALVKAPVRLLSFCLMPNHFHFVVTPVADGQLSTFMKYLLGTHSHRWHAFRGTTGLGAVYQGRFKAFPIQSDSHFYSVCRYVERNALRAGLVTRAEHWRWSSLYLRCFGASAILLSDWPVPQPLDWLERVNLDMPATDVDAVRSSIATGRPFGDDTWTPLTARAMGIERTLRRRGRPTKEKVSGAFFKGTRHLF